MNILKKILINLNRNSYIFVTEPLIGTLDYIINQKQFDKHINLDKFKYGIVSLGMGFSQFNITSTIIQCLTSSEILITTTKKLKIGGAFYATTKSENIISPVKYSFECSSLINVPYGYIAPENLSQNNNTCVLSNNFIFGSIIITLFSSYFHNFIMNPLVSETESGFQNQFSQVYFKFIYYK